MTRDERGSMRRAGYVLLGGGAFFIALVAALAGQAVAGVGNACFNCHNVHNSQGGNLLILSCVGCHSHTGPESIVPLGDTRIPIVNNTGIEPSQPLAGGNFHWLTKKGDQHGHNVLGISNQDQLLATAPGGSAGCANSCHTSLATATVSTPTGSLTRTDGCQSCHGSVRHHRNDFPAGTPASAESGWYRFLKAPSLHTFASSRQGVSGIGDRDWEENPSSTRHNVYYAEAANPLTSGPRSLNNFCSSCHQDFHGSGNNTNGGGSNPWLRHPTNYVIPAAKEFASLMGTAYNPQVPVGRPVLTAGHVPSTIAPGDMVTCLSCHRAHGSPYPDMLRWDYSLMRAHEAGAGVVGSGCFFCHTAKDT